MKLNIEDDIKELINKINTQNSITETDHLNLYYDIVNILKKKIPRYHHYLAYISHLPTIKGFVSLCFKYGSLYYEPSKAIHIIDETDYIQFPYKNIERDVICIPLLSDKLEINRHIVGECKFTKYSDHK